MRMSERLYARAVRLLPEDFAAEYGADMIATFAARTAERRGRVRRLLFTVRELSGVVWTVISERLAEWSAGRTFFNPKRGESHVMDHLLIETRHAARRLLRTPGFTIAAVLTLALAIGANTAIFTLLHRVVLSPLPYPSSDRLIAIEHAAPGVGLLSDLGIAPGIYREYGRLPSTEAISMHTSSETTLSGDGAAERLESLYVTPSLAAVLDVSPALGRWFTEAEGRPDSDDVVVLTHSLWQNRFGGSPDILGRTLRLDGELHEVIGVMPAGFAFPETQTKLIMPLRIRDESRFGGFNFQGIARLKPGVTMEQARQAHESVIADLPARFPAELALMQSLVGDVGLVSLAAPLKDKVLGGTARMLWVLLGSVTIVLLIAARAIHSMSAGACSGSRISVLSWATAVCPPTTSRPWPFRSGRAGISMRTMPTDVPRPSSSIRHSSTPTSRTRIRSAGTCGRWRATKRVTG
jgi:hypothetical protein